MIRTRMPYAIFEQTVIDLYNKRILKLEILDTLAQMYRGMSVDSIGSNMLLTADGKDLPQVCISLVNPEFVLVERGSTNDDDEYWEKELKEWSHITNVRWGWR